MAKKTCVILGNASSVFVRELAMNWRSQGLEPIIVTKEKTSERTLSDGTPIITSNNSNKSWMRAKVSEYLFTFEYLLNKYYNKFLHINDNGKYYYTYEIILSSKQLTKICQSYQPLFVFGQEAYVYGLATALCKNTKRIIFPWGHEIFEYDKNSPLVKWLIKYNLINSDLIIPTSRQGAKYIVRKYHIDQRKVMSLSWGVNRNLFHPSNEIDRVKILRKYGVPEKALIFSSPRKFFKKWGCFIALDVFIRLAKENPNYYFFMAGGKDVGVDVDTAMNILRNEGLEKRIKIFSDEISKVEMAEILSVSSYSFSLVLTQDMRSATILEMAASGTIPFVSNSSEFVSNLDEIKVIPVDPQDIEDIVNKVHQYMADIELRSSIVKHNLEFIKTNEDYRTQMQKLLNYCMKSN